MKEPEAISFNFCNLPEEYTSIKKAKFAVIPVPYDLTTSYIPGTRRGPQAIIEASFQLEYYDEEMDHEAFRSGIFTFKPLDVTASSPGDMIDRVYMKIREVARKGLFPVIIGGEHTITIGAVRAMKEFYAEMVVLQLDAHADLRNTYMDSPYSHACVARRISEICPLVIAGVRSISRDEKSFLEKSSIILYSAKDMMKKDFSKELILSSLRSDFVYLSIDLDVFDPSIMPSVGTPEPGGIGWYDVTSLLEILIQEKNIVAFDITELSPIAGFVAPDFFAAKLIYKIMTYIDKSSKRKGGDQNGVATCPQKNIFHEGSGAS